MKHSLHHNSALVQFVRLGLAAALMTGSGVSALAQAAPPAATPAPGMPAAQPATDSKATAVAPAKSGQRAQHKQPHPAVAGDKGEAMKGAAVAPAGPKHPAVGATRAGQPHAAHHGSMAGAMAGRASAQCETLVAEAREVCIERTTKTN